MEQFYFSLMYFKLISYHFRYTKLIRYYLSLNDYVEAMECCRRYGHVKPKLWVSLFNLAMIDNMFPPSMLEEILNEIGS